MPSLFGLAPGGACHAISVAGDAVRSYRTISTLPPLARVGGVLSVALSLRSPWAEVIRHRVSVEPGLSSSPATKLRGKRQSLLDILDLVAGPAAIRPSDAKIITAAHRSIKSKSFIDCDARRLQEANRFRQWPGNLRNKGTALAISLL